MGIGREIEYETIMGELTACRTLMQSIKKDLDDLMIARHQENAEAIIETQEGLAEIAGMIAE